MDTGLDGCVDALEFRAALAEAGSALPIEDADACFAFFESAARAEERAGGEPLETGPGGVRLPLEALHGALRAREFSLQGSIGVGDGRGFVCLFLIRRTARNLLPPLSLRSDTPSPRRL